MLGPLLGLVLELLLGLGLVGAGDSLTLLPQTAHKDCSTQGRLGLREFLPQELGMLQEWGGSALLLGQDQVLVETGGCLQPPLQGPFSRRSRLPLFLPTAALLWRPASMQVLILTPLGSPPRAQLTEGALLPTLKLRLRISSVDRRHPVPTPLPRPCPRELPAPLMWQLQGLRGRLVL